jgi:hypothetical protein
MAGARGFWVSSNLSVEDLQQAVSQHIMHQYWIMWISVLATTHLG